MSNTSDYDFAHNPMVDAARAAMTPEQIEDYKRAGEYMYNAVDYENLIPGSNSQPKSEDILRYAVEALRSGLYPKDLSQTELSTLVDIYGQKWYTQFGYEEHEVPKPMIQMVSASEASQDMKNMEQKFGSEKESEDHDKTKTHQKLPQKLPRQVRRKQERVSKKNKGKKGKKKRNSNK